LLCNGGTLRLCDEAVCPRCRGVDLPSIPQCVRLGTWASCATSAAASWTIAAARRTPSCRPAGPGDPDELRRIAAAYRERRRRREEEERRRKEDREETRRLEKEREEKRRREEEREEKRRREEQEGTTVRLADQLALDVEDRLTKQYDAD
jgi:hypothetical protein